MDKQITYAGQAMAKNLYDVIIAVSSTHLTLPRLLLVKISEVDVS